MIDLFKNASLYIIRKICIKEIEWGLWYLDEVPDQYRTWEICEGVVKKHPRWLEKVPDTFKIQGMCEKAVEVDTYTLRLVPDHLKTQEMCERAVEKKPWSLKFVPDRHKTQGKYYDVVQEGSYLAEYVPDWFVLQGKLKILDDYKGFCNNYFFDELIEWHDGYQKRKAQKAKIKEELLHIVWHPSRYWDWCVHEDEKQELKKLWG